jgi:methylphosphotriester-DNA--protein-cysteine methyltransferase
MIVQFGLFSGSMEVDEMDRYVGDYETEIYHREECSEVNEIDTEDRVYFESAEDAENSGLEPCPLCIPAEVE